jgi:3-oxoacyl-[acyl-carrier-protein] synthase II
MSTRRVVITGLGAVTPLGNNTDTTWKAILEGQSGAAPITNFDPSSLSCRFSASVKQFDAELYFPKKELKKMDLFIQYGIAAACEAIDDAKLDFDTLDLDRVGTAIGAGIGGMGFIEANHTQCVLNSPRRISPFFIPGTIVNMVSGQLSIRFGMRGPNYAVSTACTSGVHNLGFSARSIMYGDADVMVSGGAEMVTTAMGVGGFASAKALSTRNDNPQAASRPWDKSRDGFVIGDGAGILVLESYEHAKARGAKIYAEVVGFGMSGDAHHMTSPPPEGTGAALSMTNAIKDAKIKPSQVNYINAHGTSTPAGDLAEVTAVKQVFQEHAYQLTMSSTKSMTGHLLGAAGAVETIFTALALRDQVAPPTINLDEPDEGCDLDFVAHHAKPQEMNYALCNSFGFGGTNASLILKKWESALEDGTEI